MNCFRRYIFLSAFTGFFFMAGCSGSGNGGTPDQTLTISKLGSGIGTVTSSPEGINCGSDCAKSFTQDTQVTLTASPDSGSIFSGWAGDADCADGLVTMTVHITCSAGFESSPPAFNFSLSNELFSNLVTLLAAGDISLVASNDGDHIKLNVSGIAEEGLPTPAIVRRHPANSGDTGEICTFRIPGALDLTQGKEINVSVSGVVTGNYIIRECSVALDVTLDLNEWEAVRMQAFGPVEALEVFFVGVKHSRFVSEDTTLLYVADFAGSLTTLSDQWTVLANPTKGLVCVNVYPLSQTYTSYFTPKVIVDPSPPAGFSTEGLSDVDKKISFLSNCTFEADLWQNIWENS